jgi:hypothetical protein
MITRSLMLSAHLCLAALVPATAGALPPKQTDKLHTPAQGSAERRAILDGLARHWRTVRNPDDGRNYKGKITFHVNYLKVHSGWSWVYAEPRSSLAKERFPENSGFLLHRNAEHWEVMKLPPMDDNGDGAFNPSPADLAKIRKMYSTVATDVIPVEKRL